LVNREIILPKNGSVVSRAYIYATGHGFNPRSEHTFSSPM
jgi:hypothetical protein